jgi:hypothetical protein
MRPRTAFRVFCALYAVTAVAGCSHTKTGDELLTPAALRARDTAIAGIDYFCDHLALLGRNKDQGALFGSLSGTGGAEPWREYEAADLEARLQTLGSNDVAELWKRDDGAIFVEARSTIDTGDWNRTVHYCYRADGTLARTDFTLNSFADEPYRGFRVRHFAADGRQLHVRSETQDIETGAKRSDADFDTKEALYKKVADLPFAGLLE